MLLLMSCRLSLIIAVAVCALPSGARALDFTWSGNASAEILSAFQAAAARWQANFSDNIIVSIQLDSGALGPGTLAQTSSFQTSYTYSNVRSWLSSHASSSDDQSAVAHLPAGNTFGMLINRTSNSPYGSGSLTPYLDDNGNLNNSRVVLTNANAKVFGQNPSSSPDATITVNNSTSWDFNPRDGIAAGTIDLVGVATHELAHALGFISGIGVLDNEPPSRDGLLTQVTSLDLFRYSTQSVAQSVIDWTTDTRDKYFSVDGGTTHLASFSTGVKYGDGYQPGHWKQTYGIGIMAPAIAPGQLVQITGNDRQAFDVIGYSLKNTFTWVTPAAASWNDGINWNTDCAPTPTVTAVFDIPGTYTLYTSPAGSAANLRVRNGTVVFFMMAGDLNIGNEVTVGDQAGFGAVSAAFTGPNALRAASIYVGGSSSAAVVASSLRIGEGTTVRVTGTFRLWEGSSLNSTGNLSAGVIINSGAFSHATGALTVGTSFTNLAGTAHIGGVQSWAPGAALVVSGGSVSLDTDAAATNPSTPTLAVSVSGGASLLLNSTQHLKSLSLTSATASLAAGALVTNSLSMDTLSTLDIGKRAMIIQAFDPTNPKAPQDVLDAVTTLIGNARGQTEPYWGSPGITSSSASRYKTGVMGIAAILNEKADSLGNLVPITTSFNGEIVDRNSVLVMYALNGDMDVNGVINADDYWRIDKGYVSQFGPNPLKGYRWGDLDYNGFINADDYYLMDAAYLSQFKTPPPPGASMSVLRMSSPIIPEPSLLPLAGAAALFLRRRPRRGARAD